MNLGQTTDFLPANKRVWQTHAKRTWINTYANALKKWVCVCVWVCTRLVCMQARIAHAPAVKVRNVPQSNVVIYIYALSIYTRNECH